MQAPLRYEFRLVPIEVIDPPPLPMRESWSDEGLSSLTDSIRDQGLLQPIGVIKAGDRFRVAYGHRRRVACERAGMATIPCFVFREGTPNEEAMKVAENKEREDVNAAAEGTYYRHLLENHCDGNVERLCAIVGRKEDYVQGRLALAYGDVDVLAALRTDRIPISVAHELNRVKNDTYRRLFLDDAVNQGLTTTAVRTLRLNLERQEQLAAMQASGAHAHVEASTEAPLESLDVCVLCDSDEDPADMVYRRIHKSCLTVLNRKARTTVARAGGGA